MKNEVRITGTDIAIGLSVIVCLFICAVAEMLGFSIQALAAGTGAVMCTQDTKKASWGAGINRILGVICGGLVGISVVAIDNAIQIPVVFYILCGVGIVLNLLLCKVVKLPFVQARVSCMSLLLVVLVLSGPMRFQYAIGRLVGTLLGAIVALFVSMIWGAVHKPAAEVKS